jgi:hypothetical protein
MTHFVCPAKALAVVLQGPAPAPADTVDLIKPANMSCTTYRRPYVAGDTRQTDSRCVLNNIGPQVTKHQLRGQLTSYASRNRKAQLQRSIKRMLGNVQGFT